MMSDHRPRLRGLTLATIAVGLVALGTGSPGALASHSSPQAQGDALSVRTPKALCAGPDAALHAGRLGLARRQYEALGESKCAAKGLAAINSCLLGDAYSRIGHRGDGQTAYKSALSEEPAAKCAGDGISRSGERWPSTWASWIADAIPKALVLLGAALGMAFVILLIGYWKRFGRLLGRVPIVRRVLSPRLTITAIDDSALDAKVGTALSAHVKERLQRFREETLRGSEPDYELDNGSGDEEFADLVSGDPAFKTALDNARELSDQTKTLANLLGMLYAALPIVRMSVGGAVAPTEAQQASATVTLERDAKLRSTVTFAGPPSESAPTGASYVALSDHAAAWVQFVVAQTLASMPISAEKAQSYAFLQRGLDHELAGDYVAARTALKQALALNRSNWAARVNLALTEARLGDASHEAIEILRTGLTEQTGRAA